MTILPAFQMPALAGVAATPPPPPTPPMEELVEAYRKARDARDAMVERQKNELRPIRDEMDRLEEVMQAALQRAGANSMRTDFGTVFTSQRRSYKIEDPAVFRAWVEQQNRPDFYENRISKETLDEFINAGGNLPPGVKISTEVTVNVRKS